ncbi:MAG: topoisomerase DNA-binding C4 zinc finger domain-containing protein [Promethearchaeota archaeon]
MLKYLRCKKELEVRKSKRCDYLGSTSYPECIFAFPLPKNINCSSCGKYLVERKSSLGEFLGCVEFPKSKFAYYFERQNNENLK